jgi:hypothetical protein
MSASSSGGPYVDGTFRNGAQHCDSWRIQVEAGQPVPPRSELKDFRGKRVIWGELNNWDLSSICRFRNGTYGHYTPRCSTWNKGQGCRFWLACQNGDHPPGPDHRKVRYITREEGEPLEVPKHITDMTFENICWQAHAEGTCSLGPGSTNECHRFHACTPWSPNAFMLQEDLHDLRPQEVTEITRRPTVDKVPKGTWLLPGSWLPLYDLSMRHCKDDDELMLWRPINDPSILPPAYDEGALPGNFPEAAQASRARSFRCAGSKTFRLSKARAQQGQPVGEPNAASSEMEVPKLQGASPPTSRKAPPPPPPNHMAASVRRFSRPRARDQGQPVGDAASSETGVMPKLQAAAAPSRKAPPPPPPNYLAPPARGRHKVRFCAEFGDVTPGAGRSKTPGLP